MTPVQPRTDLPAPHGLLSLKQTPPEREGRPTTRRVRSTCRCSSMVEHLPSKQVTRVRFPSPAPGPCPSIIFQTFYRKENSQNVRLPDHQERGTQTAETSWNGIPDVHINLTPAAGSDLLVHHRIPVVARLPDSRTFISNNPYYSILYDFFVQRGFPQKLKGGNSICRYFNF